MIKRLWVSGWIVLTVMVVLSRPEVSAHYGLPNSIDHRTVITVHRDSITVDFSVFITEVLALLELREMNADGDERVSEEEKEAFFNRVGDELRSGLELILDGEKLKLERIGGVTLGMPFMKRYHYRSVYQPKDEGDYRLEFRDSHYPLVVGGRTIDFVYGNGVEPIEESARDPRVMPDRLSEEIKTDPQRYFPFETYREAVFRVTETAGTVDAGTIRTGPSSSPAEADERLMGTYLGTDRDEGGRLERIIAGASLTPGLVLFAILLAVGLGAVHGLTPGHGKTIVAAYLVGSRGTPLAAVWLGIIVTLTHTISVFILGLVLLYARDRLPENYTGWLGFVSGCLITVLGVVLFIRRIRSLRRHRRLSAGQGGQDQHDHGHHHHQPKDSNVSGWGIVSLGISGGIIPCPEALAVLLLAFAVNRTLWGLLILVAFSIGLALVLVSIGLVMVTARRLAGRWFESDRGSYAARLLPGISALVIALLGMAIAIQSLYSGGIIG